MLNLAIEVLRWLREILGVEGPGVQPWGRANALPHFLRDAFQCSELELLGQPVVLAIGRAKTGQSLRKVRTWRDKVERWPVSRPLDEAVSSLSAILLEEVY